MMKYLFYMITLMLILSSCSKQNQKKHLVFNVSTAFYTPETNKSTNIIGETNYYKLSDEHIIGEINRTHLYGDTICIVENDIISAFNISTGEFLWKINSQGRGPQEYSSAYRALFMPHSIYIDGWNNDFKVYNLSGKYVKTLFVDSLISMQGLIQYMPERLSYKDNMFVGYHFNRTGLESEMIVIIDENGNNVNTIKRNDILQQRQTVDIGGFGILYKHNQDLCVWEQSNDTIFRVINGKLDTYIILSRDEINKVSYDRKSNSNSKTFFLHNFKETSDYLIINAFAGNEEGVLLCDKRNAEVKFYLNNTLNDFENAIFQNALSDQYCEELVTFIYPYQYIEAKKGIIMPVELSNEDITENSNPIIIKAKLK